MQWILGLDLGTSSVKAIAVSEHGRLLGENSQPYAIERPQRNWAEQHPAIWWEQACAAIRGLLQTHSLNPHDCAAVGLTGQMHGLVALDRAHQPIRPAIIWADGRSADQITALQQRLPLHEIIRITGNRPAVGFMALSLMWLQQHEPEAHQRIAHVLLPKDYIGHRLTGEFATEPSDASATLLFDLGSRTWSARMLEACGVNADGLPRVVQSHDIIGRITSTSATATGLPVGTPVIAGGGDTQCAALALGVTQPGTLACTIGTAAQLFLPTLTPVIDPHGRIHALCHCLPDTWHVMGAHLNGGLSLTWVAALFDGIPLAQLLDEAAQVPAGAAGLIFLPYLQGERTPHFDADARGVFFGLSTLHTRRHMVRAVLEGVAFSLRDSLDVFMHLQTGHHQMGIPADPNILIKLTGGAAQSPLWAQILADVLGLPMEASESPHGSAMGAALLAGMGIRLWLDPAALAIKTQQVFWPTGIEHAERYNESYAIFKALYPALKSQFTNLKQLKRRQ